MQKVIFGIFALLTFCAKVTKCFCSHRGLNFAEMGTQILIVYTSICLYILHFFTQINMILGFQAPTMYINDMIFNFLILDISSF